jgi:hypothetical protein
LTVAGTGIQRKAINRSCSSGAWLWLATAALAYLLPMSVRADQTRSFVLSYWASSAFSSTISGASARTLHLLYRHPGACSPSDIL